MTIETKFKPRDHVWTVETSYDKYISTNTKCSFCNGTGRYKDSRCFARDGYRYKCIDGIIHKFELFHFCQERIVEDVLVTVNKWSTKTEYNFDNESYDESDIYATKEEAQVECDRRNVECNSPQQ